MPEEKKDKGKALIAGMGVLAAGLALYALSKAKAAPPPVGEAPEIGVQAEVILE